MGLPPASLSRCGTCPSASGSARSFAMLVVSGERGGLSSLAHTRARRGAESRLVHDHSPKPRNIEEMRRSILAHMGRCRRCKKGWFRHNVCVDGAKLHAEMVAALVAQMRSVLAPRGDQRVTPKPRKPNPGDMRGDDANPKQTICSQCGESFFSTPCGFTHAAIGGFRTFGARWRWTESKDGSTWHGGRR